VKVTRFWIPAPPVFSTPTKIFQIQQPGDLRLPFKTLIILIFISSCDKIMIRGNPMSHLEKLVPELIKIIRQQNTINRQLLEEIKTFNQGVLPRLNKIEAVQEMKKQQKQSFDQSLKEVEAAIKSGKG